MDRATTTRIATALVLLAAVATACADGGGNLVERRDIVVSWDASPDAWRRDTAPWDPGWTDRDATWPPDDDGDSDPGAPADPGTDPGHDPGFDPGTDPGLDPGLDPGTATPFVDLITNQEYQPLLFDLLADAQTAIRVAHLSFGTGQTPDAILAALTAAAGRGVDVRVILEDDVDSNADRYAQLVAGGVSVKLESTNRTMHAKLVVVDGRRVLVGSTNWTYASMRYNNEANWSFDDTALGGLYASWVDALWSNPGSLHGLPAGPYGAVVPIGAGQYLARVGPVIDAAKSRIWVTMYQVGWDDSSSSDIYRLVAKLAAAQARGVDVRVVLEDSDWNDDLDAANRAAAAELRDRNIDVRFDTEATTTHAKMLIADDDAVALYSGNWLYTGLENNHEAGAIVTDAALAAQAAAYFTGIWNVSL